jgi:ATP-dependent DNA helicase RecG
MSDDETFRILSEQEPDFSAKFCEGLKIEDLDPKAIATLKEKYAKKQENETFLSLSDKRLLSDLKLLKGNKLTYAALILLGEKDKIYQYLPQARTIVEYRRSYTQIQSDAREEIQEPLFIAIDKIWNYINQPASNPKYHIRQGPYIFDIPYFNEEVIREAVLNAITHRDYTITSSVAIKQFPEKIEISNPGGFPRGVSIENLIYVDSTPRSELLSQILLKTGLVEKSGQGVDKIFRIMLSEGKDIPDYSKSDNFRVCLKISGEIQDEAFIVFIEEEQRKRDKYHKLGVSEIISLYKIKNGTGLDYLEEDVVQKLLNQKLIKRSGGRSSTRYILSSRYFELAHKTSDIAGYSMTEINGIVECLNRIEVAKMKDFVEQFEGRLKRSQVRYLIEKLVSDSILVMEGKGSGTKYKINNISDEEYDIKKIIIARLKEKR